MNKQRLADVSVVLQAGGKGRRVRERDDSCAKPMLTVGGKPMIERLLLQLAAAGFRKFLVVTGYLGETVEQHAAGIAGKMSPGIEIGFYREPAPLGNAGALARLSGLHGTTLFLFADLVTDIDFAELLRIHQSRSCDATLASHYEDHQLTLGELVVSGECVTGYLEKPTKRYLICSGIAVFEPSVLAIARTMETPFGISDLVQAALHSDCRVTHWSHGANWLDVNTPEILRRARAMVAGA